MASLTEKDTRIGLLDGIRGLAIVWVFCFHLMARDFNTYGKILGTVFRYGHFGVEVFLIVSGFVISRSAAGILSSGKSPFHFIKRRLIRIFPPYLICIIFSAFIIPHLFIKLSALMNIPFKHTFPDYSFLDWVLAATTAQTFTSESWYLSRVYIPLNNPLWYVSIIVQIYFVATAALLFKKHYSKTLVVITVLSVSSFFPKTLALIPYGLFLPYWPSFAVGIFLFRLSKGGEHFSFDPLTLILYLGFLSALMTASALYESLYLSNFVFSLCCGSLIWMLLPYSRKISQNPGFQVLAVFGSFSFSLYLMHTPLYKAIGKFIKGYYPSISYELLYPTVFFWVFVLSYAWHLAFEKPFRTLGSNR